MANIEKRKTKLGTSYRITVEGGSDSSGKRIRHRTTYTPEPGMTQKQIDKAVQRAAADFERSIELGYALDNRQTFSEYAQYVLELKLQNGLKIRTYERYLELMTRINEAIGHIKLADLRPQHLNQFYKHLCSPGVRAKGGSAAPKIDIAAWLKEHHLSRAELARRSGVSPVTVGGAAKGKTISEGCAKAIADAMEMKIDDVFTVQKDERKLSAKTVLEYHRLIRSILAQANKEMLVAYNAADKASPPKARQSEPNYFQPEVVHKILEAAELVPLRWKVLIHFLVVTACRRGEAVAVKWSKIDFQNSTVRIDRTLVDSKIKGLHEDATKTRDQRTLKLPPETMELLKALRKEQLRLRLLSGDRWQDTDYIFTTDNGAPTSPQTVTSWLRDFSAKHGLPHINPHAFRHTAASVLISKGVDIVTVSKHLGHSDVSTTENYYSHAIEENKAKAAECIADVLIRKKA